jgi:hypothetical protein
MYYGAFGASSEPPLPSSAVVRGRDRGELPYSQPGTFHVRPTELHCHKSGKFADFEEVSMPDQYRQHVGTNPSLQIARFGYCPEGFKPSVMCPTLNWSETFGRTGDNPYILRCWRSTEPPMTQPQPQPQPTRSTPTQTTPTLPSTVETFVAEDPDEQRRTPGKLAWIAMGSVLLGILGVGIYLVMKEG